MADTFNFELVSPEQLLLSGAATQVVVPGTEGDFAVLARHAPVLSTMRPGIMIVSMEGEAEQRIFVRGGFAEAGPESLTVLAEQAIPVDELDPAALEQEIRNAEEDVADAKSDAARTRSQERLDHLTQLRDHL